MKNTRDWTKTTAEFYEANRVIATYAKSNNVENLQYTQEQLDEIIDWNDFKIEQLKEQTERAKTKQKERTKALSPTAYFILDTLNTYSAVTIADLEQNPVIKNAGLTSRDLTGAMTGLRKRGLVDSTIDSQTGKRLYKLV